jgi:hypothetical protein
MGSNCFLHQFTLNRRHAFLETEIVALRVHANLDRITFAKFAGEDSLCQRVFDALLDDALQRAGAEDGVVAFLGEEFFGFRIDRQSHVSIREALAQVAELDVYDLRKLLLAQRMENDRLVNAIEKFRAKRLLEQVADGAFNFPLLGALGI